MTHSVSNLHEAQTVIVGVDTHKHMHVAVAIDSRGIRLGAHSFGADSEGYRALLTWAEAYGGIEGRCCVNRNWHGTLPTRRFVTD